MIEKRTVIWLAAIGVVAVGLLAVMAPRLSQARSVAAQSTAAPPAPDLVGTAWINASPESATSVSKLRGHITVLHFWTFECINCKHNLPYYAKWATKYKPSEVQVVGVHTPELAEERKPANVREAVKALGIDYPVLIDTDGTNWTNYHQQVWPTVYVIDRNGRVRYRWEGELQWDGQDGFAEVSRVIERLRREGAGTANETRR